MTTRQIEPACPLLAGAIVAGLVLLTAPVIARGAVGSAARARVTRVVGFREENIGPEDLPSPTATPTPAASPAQNGPESSPSAAPAALAPEAAPSPNPQTSPAAAAQASPVIAPNPASGAQAEGAPPPAGAEPSEVPTELAPLGIGQMTPTLQISNASLGPIIASATTPALAASLRMTDKARGDILDGRPDDAIQLLSRAVSIDPTNSYAYFYLGRAWLAKKNYSQAITFFNRAGMAFASNPQWLGETLAFEGLAYEEWGQPQQAEKEYAQALQATPGNLMARVGYTRLTVNDAAPPEGAAPPPSGSEVAPAPSEPPAPPPPAAEPPPPAD